jgi:hypothetical protein
MKQKFFLGSRFYKKGPKEQPQDLFHVAANLNVLITYKDHATQNGLWQEVYLGAGMDLQATNRV